MSPISPENESGSHFRWGHSDGQSKLSSPTHEQKRPSPVMADAPILEKPPDRLISPSNDSLQPSRNFIENSNSAHMPNRNDSVSPELQKSDTIDDLITSWQQPIPGIQVGGLNLSSSRRSSVSALDEEPNPAIIPAQRSPSIPKSEPKKAMVSLDPILQDIQELKPESRASLERYLIALRREGAAATDGEKFRAFKTFMDKELRLKAILYGIDEDESRTIPPSVPVLAPQHPMTKTPESLPRSPSPQIVTSSKHQDSTSTTVTGQAGQVLSDHITIPQGKGPSPPTLNDESYVLVGGAGEGEYSPGGRPRISRPQTKADAKLSNKAPTISIPTNPQAPSKGPGSPSDYAPMVVEDFMTKVPGSPSANAPIVLDPSDLPQTSIKATPAVNDAHVSAVQSPPYRSVYTPFKYSEGPSNSSYAELRQAVTESGRIMSQASASSPIQADNKKPTSPSVALRQQEETFLGLIREKSMRRSKDQGRHQETTSIDGQNALSNISGYLRNRNRLEAKDNSTLVSIGKDVERYPDDFGFIRQTVLAWDHGNRERIRKLETSRRQREEQSETNIDELFNAKQIGYPDIKTLESDFKRSEIQKQQEEYRDELSNFVSQVYKPVTLRLDSDIRELGASYNRALEILDKQAVSASKLVTINDENDSKPKIAPFLEYALQIFDKLQIRHRKRVEAERERQRRSAICDAASNRVLGLFDAANKNEQDYALFEKQSAIHAAEEHDARANKLMDCFDAVVVRALGENEQFINNVKKQIQLADTETRESGKVKGDLYGPDGLRQTLTSGESVISAIAADSASILQSSDIADQLLNNADYDLSVTKARMDNASEHTFQQLQEDKAREDEKIRAETAGRLSSMNKGPEETLHLVRTIVARIGDDPEHQERIKKALEAAKKRNAARDT